MHRLSKYLIDFIFLLCLCTFAWTAQEGIITLSASGVSLLDSDLHNYASFMARKAHPENFSRDFALKEATPAVSYPTAQEWLASHFLQEDQYAVSLITVLGPCLVIFYAGWYLLGVQLLGSRRLACLLAAAMGVTIYVGWGTFWGITGPGPIPRTLYTTLVPYLILGAYAVRQRPLLWQYLFMLLAGCLAAVHSISAVSFGCALTMGFWANARPHWSILQRTGHVLCAFFAFAIPAVFFIFVMLPMPHVQLSSQETAILRELFTLRLGTDYADDMLAKFISEYCLYKPIIPLGLISTLVTLRYGTTRLRTLAASIILWMTGIIALACMEPVVNILLTISSNAVSTSYELFRALRFLPMLSLLAIFLLGAMLWQRFTRWHMPVFLALLPLAILIYSAEPVFLRALHTLQPEGPLYAESMAELNAQYVRDEQHHDALQAVTRLTPPDALIFSNTGDLCIRHISLRSLAYSYKDGLHPFHNKDAQQAKIWIDMHKQMQQSASAYISLWRESSAEYLLVEGTETLPLLTKEEIIWQNAAYALLKK